MKKNVRLTALKRLNETFQKHNQTVDNDDYILSEYENVITFIYKGEIIKAQLGFDLISLFEKLSEEHTNTVFQVQGSTYTRGYKAVDSPDILKEKLDIEVLTKVNYLDHIEVELEDHLNIFGENFQKKAIEAVQYLSTVIFNRYVKYQGNTYLNGKLTS